MTALDSGLSIRWAGDMGMQVEMASQPSLAVRSALLHRARLLRRMNRMAGPEEINADMLAFWNGKGGDTWVARPRSRR